MGSVKVHLPQRARKTFQPPSSRAARLWVAASVVTVLCVGVEAMPALGAQRTTAPQQPTAVTVSLTNSSIKIQADKFTKHGIYYYPRGAIIDFVLKNNGKQPVSVRIKLNSKLHFFGASHIATFTLAGKPIRPGHVRHFEVFFFFRSSFAMQMLTGGRVRASSPIIIV